jgi:hypothetical protein
MPFDIWSIPDEIELHKLNFAECMEYDQMQSLKEAFPEGY